MVIRRIAVVGAGIAGLACASRLAASGHQVSVYDKGRGVGGRAATRRVRVGPSDLRFDHGAQFFTARDPAFRTLVDRLVSAGAVESYANTVTSITAKERSLLPEEPRFVGKSGMNRMAKALAEGLDVKTSCQVTECIREAGGWRLTLSTGARTGLFDYVVIAAPAEQATELLLPIAPSLAQESKAARTSPCWAAMLAFSPPIQVNFEAARVRDLSPLAWVAQTNGNGGDYSCWVLHATTDWSRENIDQSAEWVADELARAFSRLAGIGVQSLQLSAHRWRYAQVEVSVGTPFAWDADLGIGVCGDWRLGPRIELAWQSGDALGSAISQTNPL
ncbi:MAG: FAD-dependent oxidoreductase [Hyphomonadaceae bacterium]